MVNIIDCTRERRQESLRREEEREIERAKRRKGGERERERACRGWLEPARVEGDEEGSEAK